MRPIIRGGSWVNLPGILRSANRIRFVPDIRYCHLGFRVVEDIGGDRYRVIRGGSWFDYSCYLRSAYRFWYEPDFRYNLQGFRVVEDLK